MVRNGGFLRVCLGDAIAVVGVAAVVVVVGGGGGGGLALRNCCTARNAACAADTLGDGMVGVGVAWSEGAVGDCDGMVLELEFGLAASDGLSFNEADAVLTLVFIPVVVAVGIGMVVFMDGEASVMRTSSLAATDEAVVMVVRVASLSASSWEEVGCETGSDCVAVDVAVDDNATGVVACG